MWRGVTTGGLYRFDALSGTRTWYHPLPQVDMWCPTWNHGLIVAYTDRIDVIAPDTAVSINTIYDNDQAPGAGSGQAAVVLGNLAYVTNGGRLVAYDLLNTRIAWALAIGASGQVATDGNELFVIAHGSLSARAPSDGTQRWSWTSPSSEGLSSNLIVTDSHLIAGDSIGTYLVNRTTHQADAALPATGMLAYGADTLVMADTNGIVHAYHVPTDSLFTGGFD